MKTNSTVTKGLIRWAAQMVSALVIFGAILFLCAGRLDWTVGWVYLGVNVLTQILSAFVLIPRQSEMLADRSSIQAGTKSFDRFFAPAVMLVGSLAVVIVAGLDARFGWSSSFSTNWWILGIALSFGSQLFVLWAMASNPFFSTTVRIQGERGHEVIYKGPYGLVRHPGYAGSLLFNLAVPLLLASWWTFIPAVLTILLLVVRTGLEDGTLQAELAGYPDYAQLVRYRLIPGIW